MYTLRKIQGDLANEGVKALGLVKSKGAEVVSGLEGRAYVLVESGKWSKSMVLGPQ